VLQQLSNQGSLVAAALPKEKSREHDGELKLGSGM